MSKLHTLSLGFLEFHPGQAARALEDLDEADAAAFLDDVPVRICTDVVSRALPHSAVAWLEQMTPPRAAAIVQDMPYQDATTVLRLFALKHREALLEELPTTMARNFKRSLVYPTSTVGGWMDPSAVTFSEDTSVAEGLKQLQSRRRRRVSHLIVTGPSKSFIGLVTPAELLRSAASATLADIADTSVRPLSNRALLASVLDDPGWDDYSALPVVGRKGNVLGTLSRSSLKKGLVDIGSSSDTASGDSILAHLGAAMLTAIAGLVRVLIEPDATPQRKNH